MLKKMEVKVKNFIFILLVFVLFVSCSLFNGERSTNNISDWFPKYAEGAIITYSVIDSLHRGFENDTIRVDNYSRKNYQATETIASITNNSEKIIVRINYADENDSMATYHLICDKNNNRIIISEDTIFSILNDIMLLYIPIVDGNEWVSKTNTYSIINTNESIEVNNKWYPNTICIKANTVDDSYEHFWLNPDKGIIKKKIAHKEVSYGDTLNAVTTSIYSIEYSVISIVGF